MVGLLFKYHDPKMGSIFAKTNFEVPNFWKKVCPILMAKSVHVWRHFSKSDIPKQIVTSAIFDLIISAI